MTNLNSEPSSVVVFLAPSPSQRAGGTIVAVFALLSFLALAFVAFRAIRIALTTCLQHDDSTSRPPETLMFRTQLGHYIGCLILGNVFISLAGLIDFNWVSPSGLTQGSACSAQAALMEIGIWSTSWFTVALGVNNLNSFVFRIPQARWQTLAVVGVGWLIAVIAGLVPVQAYGPVGSSCGVMSPYSTNIFALQALPIILTVIVSVAVYSVIFIILHVQPSKLQPGGSKSTRRREDRLDEQHGIVRTIIWTLFWFPLAFVLLFLPYCVAHIITATGQSLPFASSVFVEVCVAMLGLVNVGLLCNTLRVIGPVYRSRSEKDAAADETFGNDASYESPISPQGDIAPGPPVIPPEHDPRMHNGQEPLSHSRDSSWSSVNSNAELLERASGRANGNTGRSLRLSQQSSDPRLHPASQNSRSTSLTEEDQDFRWSSQSMTDTCARGIPGRELTFKAKAPPALNLSQATDSSSQLHSARDITTKSATLAARLGIPIASARTPHTEAVDQGNGGVPATIPRIMVNPWSPDHVDQNPSPSFTISLDSDCDSEDEGAHVKPLPHLPESSDGDQVVVEPFRTSVTPWTQSRSQRATMASVWSQESSRHTLNQPPDEEAQEAYRQLMGLPPPTGDQAKAAAKTVGSRGRQPSLKTSTGLASVAESPYHERNDSFV